MPTSARSVTEEAIQARVRELGARISEDYRGRNLTLVSVLKGSLPFMADLMRAIDVPVRIDLMEVSSYGGTSTESSGLVRILKDLSASIADEDVLLVEDIIDTGLTLNYLIRYLRGKNPASLDLHPARQACPAARQIPVDYTGSRSRIDSSSATGSTGELYWNHASWACSAPRSIPAAERNPCIVVRSAGDACSPRSGPSSCSSAACCRGSRRPAAIPA
jgi:hypoxanthine phosphoribosyltransferase